MHVKFELEDMCGVEDLTPGKHYEVSSISDNGLFARIVDDVEAQISVLIDGDVSGHLDGRAAWEIVSDLEEVVKEIKEIVNETEEVVSETLPTNDSLFSALEK